MAKMTPHAAWYCHWCADCDPMHQSTVHPAYCRSCVHASLYGTPTRRQASRWLLKQRAIWARAAQLALTVR